MWKVGSKESILVGCNVKSNFPLSIEMNFGGARGTPAGITHIHGMWFEVEDAKHLIERLQAGIATIEKIRAMPLLEDAIYMLGQNTPIEEIRGKLRGTSIGEDFPTCSYVEEVLREADKY